MSSRRPTSRQTRGRAGGRVLAVSGPPPAVPVLTAPATGTNVFNTIAVTVSATSTDLDLDRIDWVLDSVTVVATDATSPYSQSWTPTGITPGDHTLLARAIRAGQQTDSATITLHVGEVFSNLVTSVPVLRLWQTDFEVTDAGGGLCSSWGDVLSANAAVQATGSAQAAIGVGLNGHPKLTFTTAGSKNLKDPVFDFPAPGTTPIFIWTVASLDTWVVSKAIYGGNSVSAPQLATNTSTPNMVAYDGTVSSLNNGFTLGTPAVIENYYSNTIADYLKIGSVNVTGTNLGNLNPSAGWYINGVTGAAFADCTYYAHMITQGLPTPGELAALRAAAVAMYPGVSA